MNNDSTLNNSLTDWKQLDTMQDTDIDLSDCPEVTPEMFAKAVVRRGGVAKKSNKEQVPEAQEERRLEAKGVRLEPTVTRG